MSTPIEWTDETWNPVRGCSRVSEGCRNCYAERQAARFSGQRKVGDDHEGGPIYADGPFSGFVSEVNGHASWTGKVELIESKLQEPLGWKRPRRIFVNSMSDLFHEALPDEAIARVFHVMHQARQHTFQVLTKRAPRMNSFCGSWLMHSGFSPGGPWPLPNVWLGVSVEDQRTADERIPLLLETPAAVRFVSYEPALGPVSFHAFVGSHPALDRPGLDWIIVGGESGPGARPFDIGWARNTIAQCKAAGVACFVKQLGAHPYIERDAEGAFCPDYEYRLADKKGGDWTEWPADLRLREFPGVARALRPTASIHSSWRTSGAKAVNRILVNRK